MSRIAALKTGSGMSALKQLTRNKAAMAGLMVIILFIFMAVFAPYIAPHDPYEQNLEKLCSRPAGNIPWEQMTWDVVF